jgi:peptidoglycan hydrolase CwlO-like protein
MVVDIYPKHISRQSRPNFRQENFSLLVNFFISRLNFRGCLSWLRYGVVILVLLLTVRGNVFVGAPGTPPLAAVLFADTIEERQQLEQKLTEIEKQITDYENNILEVQAQKKTLANEVKILDAQIAKVNLQIKLIDVEIQRLNLRIDDLGVSIDGSESKINQAKIVLASSLQNVYEFDRLSLVEILVGRDNMSDFFDEVNANATIQSQLQTELEEIRTLKRSLEDQQNDLIGRREDQQALLDLQEAQRRQVSQKKQEKDTLLKITKGKESAFQQLLKESQKSAAEIRAQLYKLIGGGEIKFGDAVQYAEFAYQQTGVRPAFLLAVLDKESALGKNVGRCSWESAMHPTRDKPVFLQITQELSLNPNTLPVSCPIISDGAYGGAMGIAQFLPSTWMLYKNRIQAITNNLPSPWNPRDAFLATALYLSDAGASKGGYTNERIAAARYYAGSRWRYYLGTYGDRVMSRASYYEDQIAILKSG